jgi:trigger factor
VKVTVERTAPAEAVVSVEVEAPRVEQAVRTALGHLSQRYVFPGFRRGKAPRNIVESFLGRDAIYQEAISHLVESTFDEAVDQERLRPVAPADMESEPELVEGSPLVYTARVAVRPDVDFPNVRELKVEVQKREIGDGDVDTFIDSMRRQRAKLVEASQVSEHSVVRAEVMTEVDGEVVEAAREGLLDMEEGDPVITGLTEALVGSPAGETREVVWTVPEDNAKHAGKEALTRVHVLEVRDRVLPPLDEDLAKSMGATSLGELRTQAHAYLAAEARNRERQERLDQAVDALVDAVAATVPEPLVERQSDILWEEFLAELRRQRIPLEAYVAAAGKDEAAVREGFRPQAERRAKRNMVLEALADREGLEPEEGEIRAAADRLLGGEKGRRDGKRTLSRGQRTYIRDVLMREKALNFLADIHAPIEREESEAPAGGDAEPPAGEERNEPEAG